MKQRLFHVSDTHGHFPLLRGRADFVVHSGDFFPNRHNDADPRQPGTLFGRPDREEEFQTEWLNQQAGTIKEWLGGRDLLYCPGNHDYYDPTDRLAQEGVACVNLSKVRPYYRDGILYYGLPQCPYDVRPWNYSTPVQDMIREVTRMGEILKGEVEVVLVAHCPPAGILDKARTGTHYGNTALTNYLAYESYSIKAVLCGHIHEDHGITLSGGVLISNAACSVHNLELEFENT